MTDRSCHTREQAVRWQEVVVVVGSELVSSLCAGPDARVGRGITHRRSPWEENQNLDRSWNWSVNNVRNKFRGGGGERPPGMLTVADLVPVSWP